LNPFIFLSVALEHDQRFDERIQIMAVVHRVGATKLLVKDSSRVLDTHMSEPSHKVVDHPAGVGPEPRGPPSDRPTLALAQEVDLRATYVVHGQNRAG
jgi:hypothetical protein